MEFGGGGYYKDIAPPPPLEISKRATGSAVYDDYEQLHYVTVQCYTIGTIGHH